MPPKDKYTDPELRDQVKKEIHESDKGGEPGQWSARKAQMMASEYKKRGGSYTTDKENGQDESQENLQKWGEEEWQTKDGSAHAKQDDGTQKRYLPKKAWEQMDEDEKEETDQKKQSESKGGKQFVGNTDNAKNARANANEEEAEAFDEKKGRNISNSNQKSNGNSKQSNGKSQKSGSSSGGNAGGRGSTRQAKQGAKDKTKEMADAEMDEDDDVEEGEPEDDGDFDVNDSKEAEAVASAEDEEMADDAVDDDFEEGDGEEEPDDDDIVDEGEDAGDGEEPRGQKRGRTRKSQSDDNKARKTQTGDKKQGQQNGQTIGSKHDDASEPGPAGSKDRLPKVGQRVSWKALPGWVHGKVLEIVYEDKEVGGTRVKGGKNDPRLALESDNGKVASHKPEGVYFE